MINFDFVCLLFDVFRNVIVYVISSTFNSLFTDIRKNLHMENGCRTISREHIRAASLAGAW